MTDTLTVLTIIRQIVDLAGARISELERQLAERDALIAEMREGQS